MTPLYIATLGLLVSLLACGGGGGTGGGGGIGNGTTAGNGAAPTSSGGPPIAIEIPAVQDINDLVYISGQVMSNAVSLSQSKTSKSLAVGTENKGIGISTKFSEGKSQAACETSNQFWRMTEVGSRTDLTLCVLQTDIAPAAERKGIHIADGEAHDFAVTVHDADGSTSKMDLRLSLKIPQGAPAEFIMQACGGGKQALYNRQTVTGNSVRISSREVKGDGRSEIHADGEINADFQFVKKTVAFRDAGKKDTHTYSHDSTLEQFSHSGILDGFSTHENGENKESAQLYSAFDLSYGSSSLLPDPTAYLIGDGAAHYKAYGVLDVTECWDGDTLEKKGGTCDPYLDMVSGHRLKEVTPVIISDYTAEETLSCESIAPELEITIDFSNHPCSPFFVQHEEADCLEDTQGEFDVSANVSGAALSQDAATPTILDKGAAIDLVSTFTAYPQSFYKGTIVIQQYDGNPALNYSAQLDLGTTSWNDSYTQLHIQPELQRRTMYQLTLVGGNGLSRVDIKSKMASNHIYYFIVR